MATDSRQPTPSKETPGIRIQSAPPAKPSSDEDRRKRYAELKARMGHSRLAVEGRPGKHYLWARKDDGEELARLDYLGYIIVRVDPKNPDVKAAGMKDDGTFIVGDVILTECDQETYEFIELDNDERSNALILSAKSTFLSKAEEAGVPTFERLKERGK